jgi:hypothetical protein
VRNIGQTGSKLTGKGTLSAKKRGPFTLSPEALLCKKLNTKSTKNPTNQRKSKYLSLV